MGNVMDELPTHPLARASKQHKSINAKPHSATDRHAPDKGNADAVCHPSTANSAASRTHAPRPPKLDERLRAAADWVTPCDICADIGCDHGRLSAVLLLENRCQLLLAADISEKALQKAKVRLHGLGLESRAVFAVADGLAGLDILPQGQADTVCILGMGGETVAGILRRGQAKLHGATLILGAQTELYVVREALEAIGYQLTGERIVSAEERLYVLMRATPAPQGAPRCSQRELLLGPCLLRDLPICWLPWLERRQRLLTASVTAMQSAQTARDAQRLAQAQVELRFTQEALSALRSRHATETQTGEETDDRTGCLGLAQPHRSV